MEMNLSYIITFISGGLAGAVFKYLIDNYRNKIQIIKCHYVDDETISKIPATFATGQHENLHSKEFKIINTTNRDIPNITITFTFEPLAEITKVQTTSKLGIDEPKGKIKKGKKNECYFTIKNFNRKDEIEVYLEVANLDKHDFNIQESNCIGIKVKWMDKRKTKANKTVKMVRKADLN